MASEVFRRAAFILAGLAILTALTTLTRSGTAPITSTGTPVHYRLLLAPGADPAAIRIDVDGADRLEIDATGDLLIRIAGRHVHHARPRAYQDIDGLREYVGTRFEFAPNGDLRVGVAEFDPTRPLTIAPLF